MPLRKPWCVHMALYSMKSDRSGSLAVSDGGYRLQALRRGSLFPKDPFSCRIHSVFSHAINLEVSDAPLLYTLVTNEQLTHPLTSLISAVDDRSLDSSGIEQGQSGYFDGTLLQLGPALMVDFTSVQEVRSRDEELPTLCLTAVELKERHDFAGLALERYQRQKNTELYWDAHRGIPCYQPSGSGEPWPAFSEAAQALLQALSEEKPMEALTASLNLVGCGQGLTPSGDDFLCGFALALLMISANRSYGSVISEISFDTWLWGLAWELGFGREPLTQVQPRERTSRVSLSFLYLATHKKFSSLLLQLGRAFSADSAAWLSMLALLGAYGHSSGLDSATGFLYGMTVVERRRK